MGILVARSLRKNKANFGELGGPSRRRVVQTNPIGPRCPEMGADPRDRKGAIAKQSQFAPDGQEARRSRAGTPNLRRAPSGPSVRNKANLPRWAGPGTAGQGRARPPAEPPLRVNARNKANFLGAQERASAFWKKSYDEFDPQRASAKQSQFPREREWARAGKATSAGATECAKQSQCARGHQEH